MWLFLLIVGVLLMFALTPIVKLVLKGMSGTSHGYYDSVEQKAKADEMNGTLKTVRRIAMEHLIKTQFLNWEELFNLLTLNQLLQSQWRSLRKRKNKLIYK